MQWHWDPEGGGWTEVPSPTETPVGNIGKVDVTWPPKAYVLPASAPADAADILAINGIQRPNEVIKYAAAAGLPLAAACAMLEMESSGGWNIWGHDPVPTGGCYVKGGELTQTEYLCYKSKRSQLGCQGVGPCQLTYYALQDEADALGGCWVWENNIQVGFKVLANNIRNLGPREGFKRYNGSGPAAEAYANTAMGKYMLWQSRLAQKPPVPPTPPPSGDDMAQVPQDQWNNVYNQLCGTYTAWAGGVTDDKNTPYDLLQFCMRTNVEVRQLRLQVQVLQDKLDTLTPTKLTGDFGSLSESDVQRVAQAVVALQKAQSQP